MYKMKNGKMVPLTQAEIDARTAEVSAYEAQLPQIQKEEKVKELWEEADRIAGTIDANARGKYLHMLCDPSTPVEKKALIHQMMSWADGVWKDYAVKKAMVLGGNLEVELEEHGNPPYSFWDIVSE